MFYHSRLLLSFRRECLFLQGGDLVQKAKCSVQLTLNSLHYLTGGSSRRLSGCAASACSLLLSDWSQSCMKATREQRLHSNLILTQNEIPHLLCSHHSVFVNTAHCSEAPPPPPHPSSSSSSSLMSSDFNESDRCKQYGGNLSCPLVHSSQIWRENRLSAAAAGF